MTFRDASRFHTSRRHALPGMVLTAAAIVAATLFLTTAGTARADGNQTTSSGCAGLTALTLTASTNSTASANRTSSSGDCGFQASVVKQANATPLVYGASSNPCKVTFTPSPIGNTGVRVRVTHEGDCNNVEMRWRVNPPAPSAEPPPRGVPRGASASNRSSAYAYLLGEDAVGIDMIKNWSTASWTHDAQRVLSVTPYAHLWGTPHEFRFIGFYLGDGWTVESSSSGTTRHGDARVEAWSNGNFHSHMPVLRDPRARTRSELHVEANAAFYCDFELQWTNPYRFTSESDCARK